LLHPSPVPSPFDAAAAAVVKTVFPDFCEEQSQLTLTNSVTGFRERIRFLLAGAFSFFASMKLKLTAEGVYRKEYSRQQKSM